MAVRRKHIRLTVEQLLLKQRIRTAPVNVERIAEQLGVEVVLLPTDEDLSGYLLRDLEKRKAIIGVNSSHHKNRQRFTIAHELAHLLLHDGERVHIDREHRGYQIDLRSEESSKGTNENEIEANLFAAELLMPVRFLEADLRKLGPVDLLDLNEAELSSLAAKYEVSPQALTFRLANLGYVQL
jgi:Zn-dependent peptidase ImmA (M78 family)